MIYFQTQDKYSAECGKHALNNFLGDHKFTTTRMNQICYKLSDKFINPHKNIFGGDYDINVLILGLAQYNYKIEWKKAQESMEKLVDDEKVEGFFLNRKVEKKFYHIILNQSSRHWTCIKKKTKNVYTFFDSQIQNPLSYGKKDLLEFFNLIMEERGLIFIVKRIQQQKKEVNFLGHKQIEEISKIIQQDS